MIEKLLGRHGQEQALILRAAKSAEVSFTPPSELRQSAVALISQARPRKVAELMVEATSSLSLELCVTASASGDSDTSSSTASLGGSPVQPSQSCLELDRTHLANLHTPIPRTSTAREPADAEHPLPSPPEGNRSISTPASTLPPPGSAIPPSIGVERRQSCKGQVHDTSMLRSLRKELAVEARRHRETESARQDLCIELEKVRLYGQSMDGHVKRLQEKELRVKPLKEMIDMLKAELQASRADCARLKSELESAGDRQRIATEKAADKATKQAREDGERQAQVAESERWARQRAELAAERKRFRQSHESRTEAESKLVNARLEADALQLDLERASRTVSEQAAMVCEQAEALIAERTASAEAATKAVALQSDVHSMRVSVGMLKAAARKDEMTPTHTTTLRNTEYALQGERAQREAALAELKEVREQLEQLRAVGSDLPAKRACAGRADGGHLTKLYPIRDPAGRCDAFSHEMARRLVEECGMTFEAAATANNLVLTWHLRAPPSEEELVTSRFIGDAFHRLGHLDMETARQRHSSAPKNTPWTAAADAGNKGREVDMIAISIWCHLRHKPVMEALSAADLHGDGTGKNLADTLMAATDRHGLHPEGCTQGLTDGASACSGASGETATFLANMRARAAAMPEALVHQSMKETCGIHAKVLEENHGLEAAFPGLVLVHFTRLLWECFSNKSRLPPPTIVLIVPHTPKCPPAVPYHNATIPPRRRARHRDAQSVGGALPTTWRGV